MKKIFVSLFAVLVSISSMAQTPVGMQIGYDDIRLTEVNDEVITAMLADPEHFSKRIVLDKTVTQQGFELVCMKLKDIRSLEIGMFNENIKDVSSIAQLKNLKYLRIASLKASDETPVDLKVLASLKGLTHLSLYGTKVTNTGALKSLTNLRMVDLYMSAVDDISFLKHTPEVRELILYGSRHTFESYAPVSTLKHLRKLDIYMNPQATDEKLAALKPLTTLREIRMANCKQVTTLDFIANNKKMEMVGANWCSNLKDISALKNMPRLETVELSRVAITDIAALTGSTSIENVGIDHTEVADISPLKDAYRLRSLMIDDTKVTDLTPLMEDKGRMYRLDVGPGVPTEQIEAIKLDNPRIDIKIKG